MGVDLSKTRNVLFFGGLFIGSWYLSKLFFVYFPNWPLWLEAPTPLVFFGIIYYLFDEYFWRLEIFKKARIVWFPNLNGRWKGKQRSLHKENGENVEVEGIIEIKQSFSKICLRAYYGKSESESVTANFAESNNEVYLFYTYDNDPNSLKVGTMEKHKGTAKIKKLPKVNELRGCYWNSIKNQGELEYKFEQKDLLGRF